MKKYGFVYIWYDRKHKRYYIGRRWGDVNDGYVSSSTWMKSSYSRRPKDFKRKILKTNITSQEQLREEEHKYLSTIKPEEFGKKYYNLRNNALGHRPKETYKGHTEETKKKISETKKKRPTRYWQGKQRSIETKKKISETKKKQYALVPQSDEHKKKNSNRIKELWQDPKYRETQRIARERRKKNSNIHISQ